MEIIIANTTRKATCTIPHIDLEHILDFAEKWTEISNDKKRVIEVTEQIENIRNVIQKGLRQEK